LRKHANSWQINSILDSIGNTIPPHLYALGKKELPYALEVRKYVNSKDPYELTLHSQYMFITDLFDRGVLYKSDYQNIHNKLLAQFFKTILERISDMHIDEIETDCSNMNVLRILSENATENELEFLYDESVSNGLIERHLSDYYSLRETPNYLTCIEYNLRHENYSILPILFKEIQITPLLVKASNLFGAEHDNLKQEILISLLNTRDSDIRLHNKLFAAQELMKMSLEGTDIVSDLIGQPGHIISSPYLIDLLPKLYQALLREKLVSSKGLSNSISEILAMSSNGGEEEAIKYLGFIISTKNADLIIIALEQLIDIPDISAGHLLYDGRYDPDFSRKYNFALKRWMIHNPNLVIGLYTNIHGQSERSDFIRAILIDDTIPSLNIQFKLLEEVDEYHKCLILNSHLSRYSIGDKKTISHLESLLLGYLFGDNHQDMSTEDHIQQNQEGDSSENIIDESTQQAIKLLKRINPKISSKYPGKIPSYLHSYFD